MRQFSQISFELAVDALVEAAPPMSLHRDGMLIRSSGLWVPSPPFLVGNQLPVECFNLLTPSGGVRLIH
jgi:hypothetical protein